jgi:hypothetical protein
MACMPGSGLVLATESRLVYSSAIGGTMAEHRNRYRAKVGLILAVIGIGTAVLLYFFFREKFAAELVAVAGLLLGAAGLFVGIIPLISAGAQPTSPDPPAEPRPEAPTVSPSSGQPDVEIHSGRDTFYAGRDMKVGTDASVYAEPDFTPVRRQRSDDAAADGEAHD